MMWPNWRAPSSTSSCGGPPGAAGRARRGLPWTGWARPAPSGPAARHHAPPRRQEIDTRSRCEVFYHATSFGKPDHLKYKQDGAWHDGSSDELRRAVEEFSMGLRAMGLEKGEKVAILS